jgi:hypothetical protein
MAESQCPAPAAARVEEIEPLAEAALFNLASAKRGPGSSTRIETAESQVEAAKIALEDYRDDAGLQKPLDVDSFEKGVQKREQMLKAAHQRLWRARRAMEGPTISGPDLASRWRDLDPAERGNAYSQFIDCIIIEQGQTSLPERARVCRRGHGPTHHPVGREIRPPEQSDLRRSRPLREPPLWSPPTIEAGLLDLIPEGGDWPHYEDFADAGKAQLFGQVMRWGGPYFWAHQLGFRISVHAVIWDEKKVRDALKPFLRRRDSWPAEREFTEVGLAPLLAAVDRHGGRNHWASYFGLAMPDRRTT